MGSAKAKGAGAGAVSGGAAGSAFGPVGTVVGGVVGGAVGYFGTSDTPDYQQTTDPAFAMLMEKQRQQRQEATQFGLQREQASLVNRYGKQPNAGSNAVTPGAAPTPGSPLLASLDSGNLLARYGAMLAMAR